MEACELKISLPALDEAVGESSFVISDLPITLRLSQLDAPFMLDPEAISYRTQPRLLRDIADVAIRDLPAAFNHNFTCAMEEVFTFKLGCGSAECHVELWQDHGNPGYTLRGM